jgi:putative phosphoesterase
MIFHKNPKPAPKSDRHLTTKLFKTHGSGVPNAEVVAAKLKTSTMVHVLVISDSHGRTDGIARLLATQPGLLEGRPKLDLILHLGDHCADIEEIATEFGCPIIGVSGNCDSSISRNLPDKRLLVLANYRIFMTHGHHYHVKYFLDDLKRIATAPDMDADIILFGHTHHYHCQQISRPNHSYWLINPGTCYPVAAGPSAALLTLSDTHFRCVQLLDQQSPS